jgi:hypothetical protein
VALSLARQDDIELVPALIETLPEDTWESVARWATRHSSRQVLDRAVLLGLPAGLPGETVLQPVPWTVPVMHEGPRLNRRPLVVDLSSLWAGPLCASLLRLLGCEVVKVEDPHRPDGARLGNPEFFDLLNSGARSEAVDLRSKAGTARLKDLLARADVVVEGSRPRALQQLGIDAHELAKTTVWVSITAHGREQGHRVGYGDDTAVAGGLVVRDEQGPVFVGDAIADPMTGVHAALVAWSGLLQGGGRLVDLPLAQVAATAAALSSPDETQVVRDGPWWFVENTAGRTQVADPQARLTRGKGPRLP